jgi:hypothetical protein
METPSEMAGEFREPCMFDPFKLFFRITLLFFKITGYTLACGAQSLWYVAHGKTELVGDAIGYLGRDITNAVADLFRR